MDTVTVSIYGESYSVKAGDDPSYVSEVARFVDGKMRDIAESGKVVTTSKIAILTALNIADELLKCRRDRVTGEEALSRKIDKLLSTLQNALKE
jgi:cell division protein ZapA